MKMWLKQLILMLLAAASTAMAIAGQTSIYLNKTQESVSVLSGSTLALRCSLSTVGYKRYRIAWHFNNAGPFFNNSSRIVELMISEQNSTDDCEDKSKTHILPDVTKKNSGWYFCNITREIPNLQHNQSEGTEVVVYTALLNDNWWLWIVLGVSAFILLVLPFICVLLTRRQENREEPIYANTRYPNKQPSPRPDMSGAAVRLKTASSSQNLRAPSPARYDEGKRRDKR
ncbi:uncharacterized protein LOC115778481 isoform X2 [Archocentrus centrarchus]|uniref:uncharacterized protein LOC115778481 isoform X2 n=1 Tax=Archocentrus centrarchus TaxID=63155 RepID=UPI0011EA1A35|nr:uncharacterized protein LOC115778481 isoform X2 [Archocentrus centrarchus]